MSRIQEIKSIILIKSVKLNGADLKQTFFSHQNLMNGGTIEFEMTDAPVKSSFTTFSTSKIETDFVAPDDMTEQIKDYVTKIKPIKARFVRVKATNLGVIPTWHPGAGFEAFIFVDEIFVD